MSKIEWERIPVGPIAMNSYIVYCTETGEGIIIDPGDEVEYLWQRVSDIGVQLSQIVLTHGHWDHILHLKKFQEISGLDAIAHPDDMILFSEIEKIAALYGLQSSGPANVKFSLLEGDEVKVGNTTFSVRHTPGHSPGSVSLISDDLAIVGDVLFFQSIGRTDLPGGSHPQLLASIESKLMNLDDDVRVLPGHGETTTIGFERVHNPFLR